MIAIAHLSTRDQTRDRILAAAREVIGRKGKRGATTREIAEVAGVNEATLFRHFGHKDGLLSAMAQHYCGVVELKDSIGRLSGDLRDDLVAIGTLLMVRLESLRDLICWSLVEEDFQDRQPIGGQAWRSPDAIMSVVIEYMQRRVAAGDLQGDAEDLSRFFMGMIFAHVLGRKKFAATASFSEPEVALRFLVSVFLNGVVSK
ncbi:MAG: TetR/AcrR family transcriptional regulator [Vulcanimicrobiaceae bacterium]